MRHIWVNVTDEFGVLQGRFRLAEADLFEPGRQGLISRFTSLQDQVLESNMAFIGRQVVRQLPRDYFGPPRDWDSK